VSRAITQSSIETFLDELASASATPGGGSAAAIIGAMGAALVSMMCNLTIGKKKYADVEAEMKSVLARAEHLRTALTDMVAADVTAFNAVMAAYAMPKETAEEQAGRSEALQAALKAATDVPMRCCQVSREVIDLAGVVSAAGNLNVISDAGVAVLAGHAALRSAALNVLTNARLIEDKAFAEAKLQELDGLLSGAEAATERAYGVVQGKLG
jgi:methenyltetrahydrofolate cyclohydrolase